MQPLTAPPRDGLTADQVRTVITDAPQVTYRFGVDLLDTDDEFVADISDDLVRHGSKVDSGSYRDLHRSAVLKLSDELDWAVVRLRPYMVVVASGMEVRANLGVYLADTPGSSAGSDPRVWTVECYDKMHLLDTPIGQTWSVAAGTGALAAAAALIADAGETKVTFSASGDDTPLPSGRMWPVSPDNTYRRAVNDLLGMVGRQGLWCDWDGWFRSQVYQPPAERPSEWSYTTDDATTRVVGSERTLIRDWFDVPNVWVGRRKDDANQGEPTEGDGLYTLINQSDGPTSIDSRGGRVVRAVLELDAADQASLVSQVDRIASTDKALISHVELTTAPNPLHFHRDVVSLVDPDLGLSGKWLSQEWVLPFSGDDMSHKLRAVQ